MKVFYSSFDVVLPKNVKMELGVTIFQTLEIYFSKGFVLAER
jgi:hypothetical protein